MSLRGAFFATKQSPARRGDCFAIARNDRCAMVNELRRLQAELQVELDALLPSPYRDASRSVLDRAFEGEL